MPAHRLTLVSRLSPRGTDIYKDAGMRNCYREEMANVTLAVKRPGITTAYTLTSGTAQGTYTLAGTVYAIVSDTIRTTSNTVAATIPSVTVSGQPYDIISDVIIGSVPTAILKTTSGLWLFTSTLSCTKVTDVDYPATTVRGAALLDGTFYVLDTYGNLQGSALQDPSTWAALNTIGIDQSLGVVRAIRRHLNYVLVLGDHGSQAFYNAANPPPGSPLSPATNVMYLIGCASGDSIVSLDDNTIFIAKARQTGRSIMMFSGLSMVVISSPFVEKLLNSSTLQTVSAFGLRISGHSFYVLSMGDLPYSLVFDLATKDWQIWTSFNGTAETSFQFGFPLTYEVRSQPAQGIQYLQNLSGGSIVTISASTYKDLTQPIVAVMRTPIFDGGTSDRKFFSALTVIGDTAPSTIAISYSNDDYTTFSTPRNADLSAIRKQLRALGSDRYRSFLLTHTADSALRVEAIELNVTV